MQAGKQNRRVAIDVPMTTQNATGEEITDFVELSEVWASIEPIRGREALLNGLNAAQMDTRIRMRWSEALDAMTTEWRIRYKETYYDLISIAHIRTGHRELEILAKSGTNLG
jgi:SPP1 family predicted phage head-tail adaptor